MALKYPDRLESNNPAAYGIIKAIEVAGHKTVQSIEDLYSLADAILSDSGTNANNDAIGQKWYVISKDREYELVDWNNRKSTDGWKLINTSDDIQSVIGNYTINGKKISDNPVLNKEDIGLGNVDNTADADKPISTVIQNALDGKVDKETNKSLVDNTLITKLEGLSTQDVIDSAIADKIPLSQKGTANGVATLGEDSKIPSSQLPSYVDDVLEYNTLSSFPQTGESGKIYVSLDTNLTYRWSGTTYTEISQSLALGETSSTAFAGDRGKALEDKINSYPDSFVTRLDDFTYTDNSVNQTQRYWQPSNQGETTKTINAATSATAGVMTAKDKTKLDGLANVATSGSYNDLTDRPTISSYSPATSSNDGLMSSTDKAKLDDISNQATLSGFTESTEVNENLEIQQTDTINQGFGKLQKAIKDNELTIAQALNAFKDNIGLLDLNASLPNMSSTHYMTNATTIVECLQALDSKLYEVEQALTLKTV